MGDPPTKEQIAQEQEEMNSVLPPPSYDHGYRSKKRFEEVKRRSIVKRRSLIEIQSGKGSNLTKEQLLDVKVEDRPDGTKHYAFGGDENKKKKKKKKDKAEHKEKKDKSSKKKKRDKKRRREE